MSSLPNNPSPFLKANIFSRFFHCWLSSLITRSHKQGTLHVDDLYDLPIDLESESLTDKLETNWLDEVQQCPHNPSLIRGTLRTMGWKLFLIGLLLIPLELLNIAQPLMLTYFMEFFEPCSTMSVWYAWLTAVGVIMILLCINLIFHRYVYMVVLCGVKMRVAYAGLVFRKVLRLSSRATNNFSSGKILNLIANDVNKVELIAPLQVITVIFLLWHFVRYIAFIAIGYTLLLLLIQPLLSRFFLRLRAEILKITDERVKTMSEILKSMRIVKMYCWESAFESKVRHIRNSIDTVLSNSYLNVTFLIMYGSMWLLNIRFDTRFFTMSYILLNYTRQCNVTYFNFAIRDLLQYIAAEKRIRRVIHATALDMDFVHLSHGANTVVGDQGVMLSGGQKARVNLARALYRNADIYLLDDPLSAVDAKVSKHLFEKSIKHFLREKISILVTHQIQYLQDATQIIVLDNGNVTHMGTYEELLTFSSTFAQLLEDINQHEEEQQSVVLNNQLSMNGSINSEKDPAEEEQKNLAVYSVETKQEGTVKFYAYISYLRAGIGVILGCVLVIVIFSVHQVLGIYNNWWLVTWSDDESRRYQNSTNCMQIRDVKTDKIHNMTNEEWTSHRNERFYILCALVFALCILIFLRLILSRFICLNAARVLHNKMFERVIRCPISFFDMNPSGRILNRFTSDVATMDESLPTTVTEFLTFWAQLLVGFLNPWSFISAIAALSSMIYIRYRFAPCSRDLKRLMGTTRSPVYSQLTSTIHGLKVIRSYHAENICTNEFFQHLDNNTRVNFLLTTLNRWSAMRFDWISLILIMLVIILAIIARLTQHEISSVEIALTLTYSLNLMSLFQWTIRQSVEVETQMTSVERVLDYCSLEQEESTIYRSHNCQPPSNWPQHGRIIFDNVSMSHSSQSHSLLALHHVSFIIKPTHKIGIVGRTGAGKSSLIQTLFRMGTLVDGHIIIDDIDISTLSLGDVRRRLSIIPQDPVLFTGTMRSNLDQFDQYSDAEIWDALEQVQLKKLVRDIMPDGLQSCVSESGANLSVGQKQLVCLARAILKKSKILVIDEATANVDNATDELIQKAIREQFITCTVLTVAHRLRTVIDSDHIMVLSDGRLVEFDSPEVLLSDNQSYFTALVKQAGPAEAEYLRTLANSRTSYDKQKQNNDILEDETSAEDIDVETDPLIISSLKML
ncbi:hypothetical protein I4U23_001767 [Adineta vaga]|nr:hypothetical protein I4U23_001767 [Adineta vaga]